MSINLTAVAGYYRSRNMAAVVFTVDAHTATGHKALSSLGIVCPLYAVPSDLGIPIVFHTGQTGLGPGLPGGRQDGAISIATHKVNVYIDLSGWSPKYFPPQLVRAANGLFKHKVMFGSDYPLLTPDRWLSDFAALDVKDEVRPLILKDNAIRALRLGPA